MSLSSLVKQARAELERFADRKATWIAVAPGRVNLIGEHVDYNDGCVLPLAIDRHVVIAASPRDDVKCRWHSVHQDQSFELAMGQPIESGEPAWSNYVRGVVAGFADITDKTDVHWPRPAFDAVIVSDVPAGGGLSSSAALEVAVATLLEAVTGHTLDPRAKALLCQKAEHDFAGMPCGIMDQFAATMAKANHLLWIDCRSQQVEHIPLTDAAMAVMVIDTGVHHELTDGGYASRRQQCEAATARLGAASLRDVSPTQLEQQRDRLTPIQYRRARHVVTEIERTHRAVDALRNNDMATLGQLMAQSHASLRDDYEVSCAELDLVVDAVTSFKDQDDVGATAGAVVGSRMTGGGFGGCAVCLVRQEAAELLQAHIATAFHAATGVEPAIFITRPVAGARCWS